MRFQALVIMSKVKYYYPRGNHNLRLRQKAIDYIKRHPNATDEQIRFGISEKATNVKRRSISLKEIRELKKVKIKDDTDIYLVIGKLRIYDWDYSPPRLATEEFYLYQREFFSKSSAIRHYNEMVKEFGFTISEYAGIPNMEMRTAVLAVTKTEWYNNEKRFPVIKETFW